MLRTLTEAMSGDSLQLAGVQLLGEEAGEAAVLTDDVSAHRRRLAHCASLPLSLLLMIAI